MKIIDYRFKKHIWTYLFQCLLAAFAVLLVLLILDSTHQTAIIASIGASAFIVFTAPNAFSSRVRSLLGGYMIGSVTGIGCSLLAELLDTAGTEGWGTTVIALGAISVGISIFLMVITDTEHPPAAGLALAFVLNTWNLKTVIVVFFAAVLLSLVKRLFHNRLKDLV